MLVLIVYGDASQKYQSPFVQGEWRLNSMYEIALDAAPHDYLHPLGFRQHLVNGVFMTIYPSRVR
jgi:hypothetical protein